LSINIKKYGELFTMNHKLRDKFILVAAFLMLLCSVASFGQVLKGSISGTVVDPQGAVVQGRK